MIFVIANHKGGVGKTTLAVHLATWLAGQGWRTVLIDLDTQGGAAAFLGLPPADDLAELALAIVNLRPDRRPPLRSFLSPVAGYRNLVVIRGWKRSAVLEPLLQQPGVRPAEEILKEILAPLLALGAHVVLDTGPYAGVLQQAALSLADHVLVPGIPERATEAGVLDIARTLAAVGRRITGVIPTRFNPITREHRETIANWRETLGGIVYYDRREGLVGLPSRIIWGELPRHGRPIWDVAPRDEAAREMESVLRRAAYDAEIA